MGHHSTTGRGFAALTVATAALLCGVAAAPGSAAAQDRGYGYRGGDRGSGSSGYRSDFELFGREEFERGYRIGREDERRRGSGDQERFSSPRWNDPHQRETRERLELAAARLREALVLMRRQPSEQRSEEALEQARQALTRVQNAMTWLPRRPSGSDGREDQSRYEQRSGQSIGAYRASGGWRS